MTSGALRDRLGDPRQFASVRRIVLDEGAEKGVQALAFSNGGGLDFWVLVDRTLDIGPLWWRGRQIGWQAPSGFRHPAGHDPKADDGRGFNRLFSGFLVSCGLEHTRQPADGQPLHGRLPFTPATLLASGVDWAREQPVLFCEGEVRQGPFRLRRRIEAPIGGNGLTIADTAENLDPVPRRQASLYHFNLGWPAIDEGTVVQQGNDVRLGPLHVPDLMLSSESASSPVGAGAASCAVISPSLAIRFAWSGQTLPHLQLWHDLRPGRCVLSIEPCTSERLPGGLSGEEPMIVAGASRRYELAISFGKGMDLRSQ